MNAALPTYVHDHLAGSDLAVELLERLAKLKADPETVALASGLLPEVREDRESLRHLANHLGSPHAAVKEMMAWLSEKALRLKLRAEADNPFGIFEAVEFLSLGTLGKEHLWLALQAGAGAHAEQAGLNLRVLIDRAQLHHARLEERRLQLAPLAFEANSPGTAQ